MLRSLVSCKSSFATTQPTKMTFKKQLPVSIITNFTQFIKKFLRFIFPVVFASEGLQQLLKTTYANSDLFIFIQYYINHLIDSQAVPFKLESVKYRRPSASAGGPPACKQILICSSTIEKHDCNAIDNLYLSIYKF